MGNLVGIIGEITLSSRPKNVKERGASGMSIEIPTSTFQDVAQSENCQLMSALNSQLVFVVLT